MVQKIPEGYTTITASLAIDGAEKAMALYEKAFGAKVQGVMKCPQTGKIMHAVLQVGGSKLFVADLFPEKGCGTPSQSSFYLYMDDVDASFIQATAAGLIAKMEPSDMFWGDRLGAVTDPYGNNWTIATHVRDVSEDEMKKAAKDWGKKDAA